MNVSRIVLHRLRVLPPLKVGERNAPQPELGGVAALCRVPDQAPVRVVRDLAETRMVAKGRELRERGVAYTDLSPIFRDNDSFLYHDVCCHLNSVGNQLLGKRIGQVISEPQGAVGRLPSGSERDIPRTR